ncbi:MAG: hypothetical protein C7B45_00450 [Sulfobacillus acidophilus]|uniref:Uncharacterized protein n=1 Tax=Sulfobacillus acidophilus TaxID=53633 RepID=A0A2T2WPF6_9FIRM|nr:MAG: hypothetical protein C7B45_00450 [Sulfobacillus acidophilus]
MMRPRRLMLLSVAALVGTIATTAAMVRLYAGPTQWPDHISAVAPVIAAPLMAGNGQPLTRWADRQALLVNPGRVPVQALGGIEQKMNGFHLGDRPVLWIASRSNRRHLTNTAGIAVVSVRVLVPAKGISPGALEALARAAHDWTRGSWNWSQGQYQVWRRRPDVESSLNRALTSDLGALFSGSGSVVIVNNHGAVLALATQSGQSLWEQHALGRAVLPPMLALATEVPAVRKALEKPHPTWSQIAQAWGAQGVWQGLQTLGVRVALPKTEVHPSTKTMRAAFSQGSYLAATPLQLAQSYLPFVSGGQMVPAFVDPARHPRGHTVKGAFVRVVQQLPSITLEGMRFRVWRPMGNYAVVIAPNERQIAILEGGWVDATVSVMQLMAEGPRVSP